MACVSQYDDSSPQPSTGSTFSTTNECSVDRGALLLEMVGVFSPLAACLAIIHFANVKSPLVAMLLVWVANAITIGIIVIRMRRQSGGLNRIGLTFQRPTPSGVMRWILASTVIFVISMITFVAGGAFFNAVQADAKMDTSDYAFLKNHFIVFLVSWIGVLFVSSFGEEVIYRGYLLRRLEDLSGLRGRSAAALAVVFSSILFGLAHYQWGAMGIVQTTGMGLALATSFLFCQRSLWPLVGAHGLMDSLLLVQIHLG